MGINPDICSGRGYQTALMYLLRTDVPYRVHNALHDKIELLLRYKANLSLSDSKGCTALILAVKLADFGVVRLLVEHGAQVEVCDNESKSALYWAAELGHEGIYNYLAAKHGGPVHVSSSTGDNLLMAALYGGNTHIVDSVLEDKSAEVQHTNKTDDTPLHYAAAYCPGALKELVHRIPPSMRSEALNKRNKMAEMHFFLRFMREIKVQWIICCHYTRATAT